MTTTRQLLTSKKHALIAICVFLGFFESVSAGSLNTPVNRVPQSKEEDMVTQSADSKPADEDEQNLLDQQTLNDEVSYEERVMLRRDLDAYARLADPGHVLFEERRRTVHKKIQERFFAADRDNDGSVSREEAAENLPQIARHFSEVDLNGDDLITINELAVAQVNADERQRLAEIKLLEAKEKEAKEAELQARRKSKQATANRKPPL